MDNQNIKVSVIMPVYKVEKYLRRAVDSVLNNNLKQIELFLVDDGSPDNCGIICDEYEKSDNRVHVIHKENAGAHAARNDCITKTVGEYLCFFDSDDFIEADMLSDMYLVAKKYNVDLAVSGFFIDTYADENKYVTLDYIPPKEKLYLDKNDFRSEAYLYFDKNMFYSPWNKLYKREYIINNNILFPKTYRDDFPFVVEVIKNIDSILFLQKQYYHFERQRSDSETAKFVSNLYDKRQEEHQMMLDLYKYWNLLNDEKSYEMISRRYIDRLIECITNLQNDKNTLSNEEKNKLIKEYLNHKYTIESIKYAKPKSIYLKVMYIPIKLKSVFLLNMMTKFISYMKVHFVTIFSKLKTNR